MSDWEDCEGPYIVYGEGATFIRACPLCGRFVKADKSIWIGDETGVKDQPNATCKKDGRVQMPFIGYY